MAEFATTVTEEQFLSSIAQGVQYLRELFNAAEYPAELVKPNLKEADDTLWNLVAMLEDDETLEDFVEEGLE